MSTPNNDKSFTPWTMDQAEKRLDEIKAEHKAPVFMIAVPVDDDSELYAVCYLRKPDRRVIKRVSPLLSQGKEVDAAEVIMNLCWLDGHEEVKTSDDYFFSAQMQMAELIQWRSAILIKK